MDTPSPTNQQMKLVLLPGLDGTGDLFTPFLSRMSCTTQIIRLPQSGPQDYDSLTEYVISQLPDEEFVLLAESFSGPIAARIAGNTSIPLMAVIAVATFLSPPAVTLLKIAKRLPLKKLSNMPLSGLMIRAMLMGINASNGLLVSFREALKVVPAEVIRDRMVAIEKLRRVTSSRDLPVLYIMASQDRLVPADKFQEFKLVFPRFSLVEIEGPHFILQARPEACAEVINRFVTELP